MAACGYRSQPNYLTDTPLARGYFLASSQDPEHLVRAEAALEEVIATTDTAAEPVRNTFPAAPHLWFSHAIV